MGWQLDKKERLAVPSPLGGEGQGEGANPPSAPSPVSSPLKGEEKTSTWCIHILVCFPYSSTQPTALCEFFKQYFGVLQVFRVKSLGKPVVNVCKHLLGDFCFALALNPVMYFLHSNNTSENVVSFLSKYLYCS